MIKLRRLKKAGIDLVAPIYEDAAVRAMSGDLIDRATILKSFTTWTSKEYKLLAVTLADPNEAIGSAQLIECNNLAYISYHLLPEYWGNGYAGQVIKQLVAMLPITTAGVFAIVSQDNVRSQRALLKEGFVINFSATDALGYYFYKNLERG